jgi:hypothetical protein
VEFHYDKKHKNDIFHKSILWMDHRKMYVFLLCGDVKYG